MLSNILKSVKKEKKSQSQAEDLQESDNKQKENFFQPLEKNQYSRPLDIQNFRIKLQNSQDILNSVYYFSDYLTKTDQEYLIKCIYEQPQEKWDILPKAQRRLQKWGGDVTENGLENQSKLPQFFSQIADKLHNTSQIITKLPNHVLLNEYPAKIGIMPHTDGPLYFPFVCSISLLSDCLFKFYKNFEEYQKKNPSVQILCEQGCLSCFTEDLYTNYLHCIEDIAIEYIQLNLQEIEGWDEGEVEIQVVDSDVANFTQTDKYKQLTKFKNIKEAVDQEFIYPIKNGQLYNYAIEIKRQKRISLTIRYIEPYKQ